LIGPLPKHPTMAGWWLICSRIGKKSTRKGELVRFWSMSLSLKEEVLTKS